MSTLRARIAAGSRRRGSEGSGSLVELVVATALALILLAMIASIANLTERATTTDRTLFGAQDNALKALSEAVNHLSSAAPLGVCYAPATTNGQPTPLSDCQTVTQSGPVIEAATSAGSTPSSPNGFCYYDYASGGAGLEPPELTCAVDYPTQGRIYIISYQALSSATYTSCTPNTCFGPQAPAPGDLPALPDQSTCTTVDGCSATLAAVVEGNQAGFSFDVAGVPSTLGPSTSAATLAGVSSVAVDVSVASGSFGQASSYSYHFTADVPATAYTEARSWAADQAAGAS